ncbi:hypothetical protein VTJ04DRAFT_5859 [Mycothermus thermophilus]|uniref:uncharacterized protein n=1 Tax=Humicola insolens TaxID=85995 RepID=UPI00374275B2
MIRSGQMSAIDSRLAVRVGCSTAAHETGQSEIKRSISVQADCGGIALFERGLLTAALGNAGGVFGN